MKATYLLSAILILAIVGVLIAAVDFMPRITEQTPTPDTSVPEKSAPAVTPVSTKQADTPCGCCADRKERLQKRIQEARARRQARQNAQSPAVTQ